ncbi:hypothetical protein FOA52_013806 [Chlamydomonas sp. UWO 241]|nr:hypothetical protein FOA52_013806 [Chlamydomonas sp. UWO 241]
MSNLRTLPGVRKAVAMALLAASQTYVRARRTIEGTALRYARAPPPPWQLLMATLLATLLAPLHALAQKLVFAKVRDAVGIKQTVISGGGALAPHLDDFYEALGLEVLNGWGLSETSPVLACRTGVQAARGPNVRGAIGKEMPGTSLRVVDPETLTDVADGALGLILARGPGVMQDTIVMASGKNVEPEPIEGALQCSPLVRHAILLGQDKRELGALIFADEDAIAAMGADAPQTPAQLEELLSAEVAKLNSARPDYQTCEHVAHVGVVRSPLSVEDFTLTRTMKPRRPEIARVYAKETAALLKRLRG